MRQGRTERLDVVGRVHETHAAGGATQYYLYDRLNPVAILTASGSVLGQFLTGLNLDERFSATASGVTESYLVDALGSTVALANAAGGKLPTTYAYSPFGVTQSSGASSPNPFQFTGREIDPTGLYYLRARYYNPTWGRFISEDPIGLSVGGNLYAYAGNSPTDGTDLYGKCYPACTIAAGAVIGAAVGGFHAYMAGGSAWAIVAGAAAGAVSGAAIGSTPMFVVGALAATVGEVSAGTVAITAYGATVAVSTAGGAAVDAATQLANIGSGNQAQFNRSELAIATGERFASGVLGSGFVNAGIALAEIGGDELGLAGAVTGEFASGQIEAIINTIGAVAGTATQASTK